MYVYQQLPEYGVYTVGFYDPSGKWRPESDHDTAEAAANRVAFLNGGSQKPAVEKKRKPTKIKEYFCEICEVNSVDAEQGYTLCRECFDKSQD